MEYHNFNNIIKDMGDIVKNDIENGFNPDVRQPGFENYLKNAASEECHQEQALAESGYYNYNKVYFPMLYNKYDRIYESNNDYSRTENCIRDNKNNIITNFSVEIIGVQEDEDKKQEVEFKVTYADGSSSNKKLPVVEFRKGNWFSEDIRCSCKDINKFRDFIENICKNKKHVIAKTIPSPGWYNIDGILNYYSHYGNVLGKSTNFKISNQGCEIFKIDVPERELAQEFWNMKNLTAGSEALVIMSYLVMAVLYTPFKTAGFVPKGLLAVIGPQSSFKTSLVMVMVKLYKRGNEMTPYYTMKSTPTSIDEGLELYKDAVMIIDDLMPSEDLLQKKELERTLEHLVRIFGDATTKKRSKNYDKVHSAEGLAVITGEYIAGVASSLSRMIVLNINKNTVYVDVLSYYQKKLNILPGFLWNFLKYFAENQGRLIKFISDESTNKREKYRSLYNVGRMAEFRVELELAIDILFEYLYSISILDNDTVYYQKQYFSQSINEIIHKNESIQLEKQPFEQIKAAINSLIENGIKFACDVMEGKKFENYFDEKYFYLHPEWLLKQVLEYTTKRGEVTAVDNVTYMKTVLENAGALKVKAEKNGVARKTVKLPNCSRIGDNRRFLCIPKEKFIYKNL